MNLRAKLGVSIGLLGFVCLILPGSLRADTITQGFTVTIEPAANLAQLNNFFLSTAVAQFNPSSGTLNDIVVSFGGPAILMSTDQAPAMRIALPQSPTLETLAASPLFTRPGPINLTLNTTFNTRNPRP